MWLALGDYRFHGGSPWSGGVAAAAGWAMGAGPAPVTKRPEAPLTLELVIAERWAAQVAGDEAPDGLRGRRLGHWRRRLSWSWACSGDPLPVGFAFADGAWRALRWLTGVVGQEAPFAVPLRHPDASLVTSDDLYEQAVAAAPVSTSW